MLLGSREREENLRVIQVAILIIAAIGVLWHLL